MLKIKDNVDLKELEKYGFEENIGEHVCTHNENKQLSYIYLREDSEFLRDFSNIKVYDDKTISFSLENTPYYCNSIEDLEKDFTDIKKSYEDFKAKIDELIKADLIEKVDD